MRHTLPSTAELIAFAEVARAGSLSAAAQTLCLTQGGVSRVLLRLEERLGVPLFIRTGRGMVPTAAGQRLLDKVRPALALLEEGVAHVKAPARQRHVLRVSIIPTLNTRWFISRLPQFQARHPDIQLVLQPYLTQDDFLRDDVDCWLQVKDNAVTRWPSHMRATYLNGKEIVPICHPSVLPRLRRPADLLQEPLLYHVNYPDNWRLWLRTAGVKTAPVLASGVDTSGGLIEATTAQLGVAVVPRSLIEQDVATGRVVVPFPLPVSTRRGYYVCVNKARAGEAAISAFCQWLAEHAEPTTTD